MATLTINDPRYMDGDPHEVAQTTGEQLVAVLEHALAAADDLQWAARGAWMTAEDHITGTMPDGADFYGTPQGVKLTKLRMSILAASEEAAVLTKAASFNPRAPIGKFDR